jgi:hypothetical protein
MSFPYCPPLCANQKSYHQFPSSNRKRLKPPIPTTIPRSLPESILIREVVLRVRSVVSSLRRPDESLVESLRILNGSCPHHCCREKFIQTRLPFVVTVNCFSPNLFIEIRGGERPGKEGHLWQKNKFALFAPYMRNKLFPIALKSDNVVGKFANSNFQLQIHAKDNSFISWSLNILQNRRGPVNRAQENR